ncbi:MAG: HVA1 family protein [Candidatus Acidiferrales bacterium]
MSNTFKRGDHVEWNSEAGRVRGTIIKRVVGAIPDADTSPKRSRS